MNNLPKSIKEKVDHIVELTRRLVTAIPDFQYHHTVFFITDDQVQMMSPDLEGLNKDQTSDYIRSHAKRCNATAVLQICEAYVVVSNEKDMESLAQHKTLATHPDRQEMLVFTLETNMATYVSMVEIKGNDRTFSNLAWHEQEVSGRFVGALRVPNHIH